MVRSLCLRQADANTEPLSNASSTIRNIRHDFH
jgi:hypothetical protein